MVALEELEDCIPWGHSVEDAIEAKELGAVINAFLSTLSEQDAALFLLRYYYVLSVRDIAGKCSLPERSVKYRLSCMRKGLRTLLKKEGY